MKPSVKSKREFIFTSSFALRDCGSRLRNLVQKRGWKLELEPLDSETYSFHVSQRWIPASVSGTLRRDNTATLIHGVGSVNWLFIGGMVVAGLVLIPFQGTQVLTLIDTLQRIITNWTLADVGTWLSLTFICVILLAQLALAGAFYLTARNALIRPQQLAQILEKTLSDAITDLPQTSSISTEDGELVTLDEMAVSEANPDIRLRR